MDTQSQEVMFSSKSDEWATPQKLFDKLNHTHQFTLDPCATAQTAKYPKYFTKEDDGLSQSWAGENVFINPPYSNVSDWVEKAYRESVENGSDKPNSAPFPSMVVVFDGKSIETSTQMTGYVI